MTERQEARDRAIEVLLPGFQLLPLASLTAEHNSNIFAAPSGQADVITTALAQLTADTSWSRHQLHARVEGSRSFHLRFGSEDATQLKAEVRGRLDALPDFSLSPRVTWERLVEPRTSTGAPVLADKPVIYRHTGAGLDGEWKGARLNVQAGYGFERYDYGALQVAGQRLDQRSRDYTHYSAHASVGYVLGGGQQVFFSVERNKANYRIPDFGGIEGRDTAGWQLTAGLSSRITPLIRGRIGLGYLTERYDGPVARPVSALAIDAALDWFATELTTVHVEASRKLENGASTDAAGYLYTRLSARADHELFRWLIVSAGASKESADFRSLDRRDTNVSFDLGARYQLDRSIYLRAKAGIVHRSSTGADRVFDYSQRAASLEVGYRF